MKYFIFICLLVSGIRTFAQDTIKTIDKQPVLLSAENKLYFFIPADTSGRDSVIVIPSRLYWKLMQDKESCKTFINLYQVYHQRVSKGDTEVQGLIDSYEGIIKTKDSAYTVLFHEYYKMNSLLSSSIDQTEASIKISKNTLDTLSQSLQVISDQNAHLKTDLQTMKSQNTKNKLRFGLAGLVLGVVIGILLMR
jgi:hypothetical protein